MTIREQVNQILDHYQVGEKPGADMILVTVVNRGKASFLPGGLKPVEPMMLAELMAEASLKCIKQAAGQSMAPTTPPKPKLVS